MEIRFGRAAYPSKCNEVLLARNPLPEGWAPVYRNLEKVDTAHLEKVDTAPFEACSKTHDRLSKPGPACLASRIAIRARLFVPICLATLPLQQKSQIVRFHSGSDAWPVSTIMRNAPDLRDVNGRYRTSQTGQRFRTDLRSNHLLWKRRDYGESQDGPSVTVTSSGSSDLLQPDPDQFALSDEFENRSAVLTSRSFIPKWCAISCQSVCSTNRSRSSRLRARRSWALEYGDSVRQMERLKDAAMRQRPPFVQSEERAPWRDSLAVIWINAGSSSTTTATLFIRLRNRAGMLRNALSTIWSKSVVRIACLFPTPLLLALLQRTMRPSVSDGGFSGQVARFTNPTTGWPTTRSE
jgi:hypothetical protein